MGHDSICPGCKNDCSRVALIKLVHTFEPVGDELDELIETTWHKECFVNHQNNQNFQEALNPPNNVFVADRA
jgi:hypothetical protein